LEDPEVIKRLADRYEFEANVEHEGDRKVIELLGNMAKKGSWLNIIKDSTCINSSDMAVRKTRKILNSLSWLIPGLFRK
jgi:hypothetical protein